MRKYFPRSLPAAVLGVLTAVFVQPLGADESKNSLPVISIIIDDIGYRKHEDIRAIGLPGPVAYAIMPHSPNAGVMSQLANELNKDVLLHLPMEAVAEEKNQFLGPGALTLHMSRDEFLKTINEDLNSFPNIIGVNNHMGSLLTRHPGHMEWLMESLRLHNKFYIDSVTSKKSVAGVIARKNNIPYLRRDVFLDNRLNTQYINSQFNELIKVAKRKGAAIAIGHPHPETIAVLAYRLLELDQYGVKLVSLKDVMQGKIDKQNLLKLTMHMP